MSRLFDDASSQYLTQASAVVGAYPITAAGWFNTDSDTAQQAIFALENNTTNDQNWYLLIRGDESDSIRLQISNVGFVSAVATGAYTTNTWQHICGISRGNADHSIYFNGGGKVNSTTSLAIPTLHRTDIGMQNAGGTPGSYFSGMLAEIGLWNVGLTDAEVASLAGGFSPLAIRRESLIAYWPLLGNASPEPDVETNRVDTNNYEMTLVNAPTKGTSHPRIFRPRGPVIVG